MWLYLFHRFRLGLYNSLDWGSLVKVILASINCFFIVLGMLCLKKMLSQCFQLQVEVQVQWEAHYIQFYSFVNNHVTGFQPGNLSKQATDSNAVFNMSSLFPWQDQPSFTNITHNLAVTSVGALPELQAENDETPLHWASSVGHYLVAEVRFERENFLGFPLSMNHLRSEHIKYWRMNSLCYSWVGIAPKRG